MRPIEHLRSLFRQRGLIAVLTRRELKARYRGSLLGYLWSMVNPLLLLAVYAVVFQFVFRRDGSASTEPYALFLFTGLLPWNYMTASMMDSTAALASNGNLLRKVLFPAEILPLTSVGAQTIHFLLALPILALGLVVAAVTIHHPIPLTLLLLPVAIALQTAFVAGLALAIAPLSVHFRDLRDLLANLLQLGFFLTPILYAREQIPSPALQRLLAANPLAPFVVVFQDLAFRGQWPAASTWALLIALALGSWLIGAWIFDRLRDGLAEEV